jgi:hypothetical protein
VYVPIPLQGFRSFYQVSAGKEMMAIGRHAAEEALPAIKAAMD